MINLEVLNLIHNRLENKSFSLVSTDNSIISELGLSLYQHSIYKVIVFKTEHIDLERVKTVAFRVRNFFLSQDYNVWNTYLLICSNEELEKGMVYEIERDTAALRKYVIRNESDLNRIPFLDEVTQNNESAIFDEEQNIHLKNKYVQLVYSHLKSTEGRDKPFGNGEIVQVVNNILSLVEKT